jgi:hypothetical protein
MGRESIWKKWLLLTVSGLFALHINLTNAADSKDISETSSDTSDSCVLEEEGGIRTDPRVET